MKEKVLVFSGHMIDLPSRHKPRFPREIEPQVRELIIKQLLKLQPIGLAIAGAACGGDILFHECCCQLGIQSRIVLADEVEIFLESSVRYAGQDWVERYRALIAELPIEIVRIDAQDPPGINLFSKTNHEMIRIATSGKSGAAFLLVLIDKNQSGQQGGTYEMMQVAGKAGLKIEKIDISSINNIT